MSVLSLAFLMSLPTFAVGPQSTKTKIGSIPSLERTYESTHTLTGGTHGDWLITDVQTDLPLAKLPLRRDDVPWFSHDTGFLKFKDRSCCEDNPTLYFIHEWAGTSFIFPGSFNVEDEAQISPDAFESIRTLGQNLRMAKREGYPIEGLVKILHVEDVNAGTIEHFVTDVSVNIDHDKSIEVDTRTSFGGTQVGSAR